MIPARIVLPVAAVLWLMPTPPAAAQSAQERARLNELDAACYNARAEKIRVAQAQKVEQCVKAPPEPRAAQKSRADCERYWGDYGWTKGAAGGKRQPNLYRDLPECKKAFEARQEFRATTRPSRQVP